MLKLYLFNSTENWDEMHTAGIIASTEKEADQIYRLKEGVKDNAYEVKEVPIINGLHIKVYWHDNVRIEV